MRFAAAKWCDDAARELARAAFSVGDVEAMRGEVESGVAELWRCNGDSWLVTRIEGVELVLVSFVGRNSRAMFRACVDKARTHGLTSIRLHTQKPWIIELFRDYHPAPVEYVVRFNLENEHGR